jgi:hypothetical protein
LAGREQACGVDHGLVVNIVRVIDSRGSGEVQDDVCLGQPAPEWLGIVVDIAHGDDKIGTLGLVDPEGVGEDTPKSPPDIALGAEDYSLHRFIPNIRVS